jgi:hypothetical protein
MRARFALGPVACAVLWCAACECRPVPPTDWRDFGVRCNTSSDLASGGSDQFILDNQEDLDRFLRFDCLRGEDTLEVQQVDFSREVVVFDVQQTPLVDGTCVKDRRVAQVEVCDDGIQMLYDDQTDPECARGKVTGSAVVLRRHVRGALGAP